jgi:diguanylate cyclase (GGDEF)-like protein
MERTSLQAATDPLTGLMNRRTLEGRVAAIERAGDGFAVAMGDLDHFKRLNDVHGHDTGDRALRLFARTLQASVRGDDLACRYGGEEFVVVFPRATALQAAEVLRRVQEELFVALGRGGSPSFTVSFGVADSAGLTFEEALRAADAALFTAKRDGRNRICLEPTGEALPAGTADAS